MSSRLEQSQFQGTFAWGADRGNWACLGKGAPGDDALAKREGWSVLGGKNGLNNKGYSTQVLDSGKNSNGVSRSPGLDRDSPQGWSF